MARKPVLENAVMQLVWDSPDGLTPREIHSAIAEDRSIAYTTVTTVVTRLWRKGLLHRVPDGISHRYSPSESREDYTARRMGEVLDTARDRSVALARFVDSLTPEERRRIQEDGE